MLNKHWIAKYSQIGLLTYNNPSRIRGRRRKTVEIISRSISTKVWDRAEIELVTADPGVASFISAPSHAFVEPDHEMISAVILLLSLIQEGVLSITSDVCAPSTG